MGTLHVIAPFSYLLHVTSVSSQHTQLTLALIIPGRIDYIMKQSHTKSVWIYA
jgi:hypothetical protein